MSKYLKLPLEQIMKQMMQIKIKISVLPLEILCLIGVTII